LDVSFFILASKRHLKCEKNLYTIKDEDKVSIQSYMEGEGVNMQNEIESIIEEKK